jgi:hypothetical protein
MAELSRIGWVAGLGTGGRVVGFAAVSASEVELSLVNGLVGPGVARILATAVFTTFGAAGSVVGRMLIATGFGGPAITIDTGARTVAATTGAGAVGAG